MLYVVMPSVDMLSGVRLSVVAPFPEMNEIN
jgi:hypothetical protein